MPHEPANSTIVAPLRLATVQQVAAEYPFTELAMRSLIFRARENGLDKAILRIGRRIRIDLAAFEVWLEDHRDRPIEPRPAA